MPIAKKTKTKESKPKTKSTTPHFSHADLGLELASLERLHGLIEARKKINSDWDDSVDKNSLLDLARERMFTERGGSFYVDLPFVKGKGRKQILVKPSSARRALSDIQAEKIENIIEDAGYDAGEYFHESQSISLDADSIFDRLGEDDYSVFQADLAEFMAERNLGDCWEMKCSIKAKNNFADARHGLPNAVNMQLEEVSPSTISIQAKRSIV
jgi:hypothetical protein